MQTSDRGIAALVGHEGIVPGPYLDSVGVWTFGVGHTAAAGGPNPATMTRGMPADLDATLAQVFAVFAADLARYEAEVTKAVTVPLASHEFDALVSFHYNTGAIARAGLTRLLNAGDRAGAATAFLNWRKPDEIVPRRRAEAALFRSASYPRSGLTVWQVDAQGKVVWVPARMLSVDTALSLLRRPEAAATVSAATATAGTVTLAQGDRGESVREMQLRLVAHGHALTADGDFGARTRAAVVTFQRENRISVDGRVGPQTWNILKK